MNEQEGPRETDGRIGSLPAPGCQLALIAGGGPVTRALRERVTVDLRGIADTVRQAAAARGQTLAVFTREALVARIEPVNGSTVRAKPGEERDAQHHVKLTLRLHPREALRLGTTARTLGLSYGDFVARLVAGAPLPAPVHDREADRAALLASTDQVAAIAADLRAFLRLLAKADAGGIQPYRNQMQALDAELYRHLDLASRLIASDR